MNVIDIPLEELVEASWNPNVMDADTDILLDTNIERHGLIQNFVVRDLSDGTKEVLSGNQRLRALRRAGHTIAPCVVVEADDARAKLIAQTLNHIHGTDDPGLRAKLMREVLEEIDETEVMAVLPETAASLADLTALGLQDMAEHLAFWNEAQKAKLNHLTFQLTEQQIATVEDALVLIGETAPSSHGNPNQRGNALYQLARTYLGQCNDNE